MSEIKKNLEMIWQRIRSAEAKYGRIPGQVKLVAVSKTKPASMIREAVVYGQNAFGENYLQEALEKRKQLAELDDSVDQDSLGWHFIGHIQSNKCADIATHFDWVHSIDRLKVVRRLNAARREDQSLMNVFIQVNLQQENSKSGCQLNQLPELTDAFTGLSRLRLRGLMAVPIPSDDFVAQRAVFARLREAQEELNRSGLQLDCLSMGMTDDLEAAIAEGATHLRIGTAIFGPREYA